MTVEMFIYDRYWPKLKTTYSPQWQSHTEHLLKLIVEGFGRHQLIDVPIEDVDGWWFALQHRFKTPVTPNKCLVRAKHIFKTAIRWKLATENPFLDIRKEREPEHTFTPLTDAQHELIFKDAGPNLQCYMLFARYTGARRSSLARLEERDVDLAKHTITFRETKNGSDYTIPMHPALIPWCAGRITGVSNKPLLPIYARLHSISQAFRRLLEANKLKGFRFHDYRHNLGTKLAEAGYDVKIRMDLLGHRDTRMAMRYTHIAKSVLAEALGRAI
jgi:integrase